MVGGGGKPPLPMTPITPPHTHVSCGPKGPSEQPVGRQALQPRASEPIGLRSTGAALGLAGIDQEHLHAPGLSQCKQGYPVNTGGFHGDGSDATVDEPVGQGVEVGGAGAETAPELGVASWGHGAPVLGFAHVDARRVRGADLESFGEHG